MECGKQPCMPDLRFCIPCGSLNAGEHEVVVFSMKMHFNYIQLPVKEE